MTRKSLWAILVVGFLMVVAPFAIGLPGKASSGQAMMDDFRPIMEPGNVETTAMYYNDVFVPLGEVAPAMSAENVAKFEGYLQGLSTIDPASLPPEVAQAMPAMSEDFTNLISLMSANVPIFEQVPAGLEHYLPLVTTMEGNVDTYDEADSLPSMELFTWFFVVPGVLLMALAGLGLYGTRHPSASAAKEGALSKLDKSHPLPA